MDFVKKQEQIVTICLLNRDLDFEVPHKLNQTVIKDNIMKEIKEEEERLQLHDKMVQERLDEERKARQNIQKGYEEYFGISPNCKLDILKFR